MPSAYPSCYMYPNFYMFPFPSPMPEGIAQGIVRELISFPIPIALWDLNTSAVGDANNSVNFVLSRWVILPTPTARTNSRTTTTLVKS
ncbi:hypothetical protein Golob_014667 [Gossypium lobatum]|uniref:Uncharacterized protein n=1 Tax=Gossypium lobatum TaxID=34289 RepID=A0A7J8LYU3_9ROSI|nr:hypothetical protein [Gossypium lobatum]